MATFTPTEFRANSSKVFNEVQATGAVIIKSKSRPEMVLMTSKRLKEMMITASTVKTELKA